MALINLGVSNIVFFVPLAYVGAGIATLRIGISLRLEKLLLTFIVIVFVHEFQI